MRILNVTASYFPFQEFGGPPVKVRALSEALTRLGHQVTVLTVDWGLHSRARSHDEQTVTERSPFGWRREENRVESVYLPSWLRYRALSWNPAVNRFCRARLHDFDVAHIFGLYDLLGPAVAKACRSQNLPYVVEPIGMFVPIVRSLWLKRRYHSIWGQAMLLGSSSIIATSQHEAAEFASSGISPEIIVLRRNGVEIPASLPQRGTFRASHGIPPDLKLILFLGRLSSKKSPDLLLQAFAMLPNPFNTNDVHLVFAGPDEQGMTAMLRKMAARLNVAPRVHFCGPLFDERKWAAYRDADVFVLPSQNENFGNTAAEAAAAGTPVIVTKGCGIAPLLENGAGLVVAHDAEALARAIERLFSEPALHSRLAAGGPMLARRLGWQEPAYEMDALYKKLVAAKTRVA